MSVKSALSQYLNTPIPGSQKPKGGKHEDNEQIRSQRLAAHLRSYLQSSQGLPSAGFPQDKLQALLNQYMQSSQSLPSAGTPQEKLQGLLRQYLESGQGLPSAGFPQNGLNDALKQYIQSSDGLPSAGFPQNGLNDALKQYIQSSDGLPMASGGMPKRTVADTRQYMQASDSPPTPMAGRVQTLQDSALPEVQKQVDNFRTESGSQVYLAHNTFNGGEIDPYILARYDQPRYQTGCVLLENMIPMAQGGLQKRPGIESMGEASGTASRLLPFIFSANESCVLEISGSGTGSTLRVWFPDGSSYDAGLNLPYTAAELNDIQITQSADVVYIVHKNHKPAKIMRYGLTDWRYQQLKFTPSVATPSISKIEMLGDPGSGNDTETTYKYVVTAIDENTGQESRMSSRKQIKGKRLSSTYKVGITINSMSGVSEFRVYKYRGGVYGYIGSVARTSPDWPKFEDNNIEPDTEDTPPQYKDPFNKAGNYPSVVFLHQQRLGFAASSNNPLTIWLSRTSDYESMAASMPPEDDDSIEVTLAANQANKIIWCMSDRQGLAVGTEGGEWILSASEGAAITPKDLSFQSQTYHGSDDGRQPYLRAGNSIVYLQRGGHVVREFSYSFNLDKYESGDLTLLARHILRSHKIVSWAYQAEPYSIVWCVLDDGKLAGLTYMKEHDVIAWHRHTSSGCTFLDVCSIPGSDGHYQVWFYTKRKGENYIERLMPFYDYGGKDLVYVDGKDKAEFVGRCIPCLPENSVQNGTSFLRVRKINAIKVKVLNSRPFKARVGESAPMPVPVRDYKVTGEVKEGDWALPMGAGWRDGDRVEMIFEGTSPVTILGMVTTVELAEFSGGNK